MPVGIGFSGGNFVAAVELVSTVIDALRENGNSSTEYQILISQLYTLETALLRVKRLDLDDAQHSEAIALQQAASQCQRTIDEFLGKIAKFQPSLRAGGSNNALKDACRKVKWALCQKEDLVRFKADLMAHTESIDMLLMAVHMGVTRIGGKKNEENHRTLMGKVQDLHFGCMQRINLVIKRVTSCVQQGRELLEITSETLKTNVQIFQVVLNIQSIITRIPGQIERQQPVYLIDALGRERPFFLEFITSAEAFTYVLQDNFKNIGTGAAKVERGEFAIADLASKRDVNLASAWETCFYPGQSVAMSLIFASTKLSARYCPKCHEYPEEDFSEDWDIECRRCKMIYRRPAPEILPRPLPNLSTKYDNSSFIKVGSEQIEPNSLKRTRVIDEAEEVALFRRVRMKTSIVPTPEDYGFVNSGPTGDSNYSISYWSVEDQKVFPALLQDFGTDWPGIARFMGIKTHVMVRNYYSRKIIEGDMGLWRDVAKDADEKRERGEPTRPLPVSLSISKYSSSKSPRRKRSKARLGSIITRLISDSNIHPASFCQEIMEASHNSLDDIESSDDIESTYGIESADDIESLDDLNLTTDLS